MVSKKDGVVVASKDECSCFIAAVGCLLKVLKDALYRESEYKLPCQGHHTKYKWEPVVESEMKVSVNICVVEDNDK